MQSGLNTYDFCREYIPFLSPSAMLAGDSAYVNTCGTDAAHCGGGSRVRALTNALLIPHSHIYQFLSTLLHGECEWIGAEKA